MRVNRLIPVAVLAFAAACSDNATSPTSMTSAGGPLGFEVEPGFSETGTLDQANTPSGGHLTQQSGSIVCSVDGDLVVTCSSYELAGVGNTNADVSLVANYSADIECHNPAGGKNRNNDIEPHAATFSDSDGFTVSSSKNGRMRVGSATAEPDAEAVGCPNANWTPVIVNLELVSFTYTLTFEGFSSPAVTIAAP
jgi:hypothetical protein